MHKCEEKLGAFYSIIYIFRTYYIIILYLSIEHQMLQQFGNNLMLEAIRP